MFVVPQRITKDQKTLKRPDLEPALSSVPACLTDHDYTATGVSKISPYSAPTPGPDKIIRVYPDLIAKADFLLPSATTKQVIKMSQGSKLRSRLIEVSRQSSDAIQVPVKRKITSNSLMSPSSNFDATPVPAKVVCILSESIAKLGSCLDTGSKSTPRSIKVIGLSFDSISASASFSGSTGPAKAIGVNVPIPGSMGDRKLPSVSTSNSVREKIFQSRKFIKILPKGIPPSDSLLGQRKVLATKKDSPNVKLKNNQTNLPANEISEPKKTFPCFICGLHLSCRNSVYRHINRLHPGHRKVKPNRLKLVCPECPHFEGNLYKKLVQHMNCTHNKHMKVLYKHFPSEDKFEQWKLDMERETCSKFVLSSGAQRNANNKVKFFYYCHRSGTPQTSKVRKRKQKAQGSSKIGFRCTAYMRKVTDLTNKTVNIEYCLDHCGHDFNPAHQPISKDLKRTIAHRLTQGDDPWDILEDVKSQKLNGQRDAMLTIRDIHNIMRTRKISCTWTKKRAYICSICNLQTKSRRGLLVHKKKKHHQCSIASNEAVAINDSYKAIESTAEPDLHDENDDLGETPQSFETHNENITPSLCREEKANPSKLVQVKDSIMKTLQDLKQTVVETNTLSVLQEIDKHMTDICSFALKSPRCKEFAETD